MTFLVSSHTVCCVHFLLHSGRQKLLRKTWSTDRKSQVQIPNILKTSRNRCSRQSNHELLESEGRGIKVFQWLPKILVNHQKVGQFFVAPEIYIPSIYFTRTGVVIKELSHLLQLLRKLYCLGWYYNSSTKHSRKNFQDSTIYQMLFPWWRERSPLIHNWRCITNVIKWGNLWNYCSEIRDID